MRVGGLREWWKGCSARQRRACEFEIKEEGTSPKRSAGRQVRRDGQNADHTVELRATETKIEGKQGILKQRLKTLDGWVARLGRRGQGRRKEREKER